MRIGWYSNSPASPSGYGQQSAQVIERLVRDGHEVAVAANYGAAFEMRWNDVPIFPEGLRQYSVDIFPEQLARWGGISIGLFDAWTMVPMAPQLKPLKLGWWTPIDHDPMPPLVGEFLRQTEAIGIAMTKFGERKMLEFGLPKERVVYIPHAFDSKTAFLDRGRGAREQMGIPDSAQLITMVAANRGKQPIRKFFHGNLEALVSHMKKHEDVWAYIHTEPFGLSDGMNLHRFLSIINAPLERIRFPEPLQFRSGFPLEMMSEIYSSSDLLLSTSMGEGYGCPTMESQMCGTPVVASAFAASEELVGPYGYKIGGQREWDENQGSWWIIPNIAQIADALEDNYRKVKTKKIKRELVREFALEYDADKVYEEKWKPTLALIDNLKR